MLGLKRGTVKLTKAHGQWARLFEIEKELLIKTLGSLIVGIEHVGSTAITDVPAKPIIDIRLAVSSLDNTHIEKFIGPLTNLGYFYMHKFPDRHFFAKGPEECRTHHLSIVGANSENGWKDAILFRDYLRNNETARMEYSNLKLELAKKFTDDRPSYTKAKEEFIKDTIERAR